MISIFLKEGNLEPKSFNYYITLLHKGHHHKQQALENPRFLTILHRPSTSEPTAMGIQITP